MFLDILKYGFLAIFFATAVIGIASIPGWIKIPEWYRKRIFTALVLEVIGVIIILFNQEVIATGPNGTPEIDLPKDNWIALSREGKLMRPEIKIETQDTSIIEKLGASSYFNFTGLSGELGENDFGILNSDSIKLGSISRTALKNSGLFNAFETAKNEITSSENYGYEKWTKPKDGSWGSVGAGIDPFDFNPYVKQGKTYYRIRNSISQVTVFDSGKSSKNLFDVDNRRVHFFEFENVFYLIRIALADLRKEKNTNYIHVIHIRMEPTLK